MGYRIDYQPVRKIRGAEKRTVRKAALIGIFFLLFIFLIDQIWDEGHQILQKLIFPGNAVVTAAALEDMTEQLYSGEPFREALETFCRKILYANR